MTDLSGKRVLILGAETDIGRAVTTAVAEAGASVAAVAATSDAEAAFAVQRLARRLSSGERKVIAQAIDATNEAAVRVMVRQVSKELGGLDAVVLFVPPFEPPDRHAMEAAMKEWSASVERWMHVFQHTLTSAEKEFNRAGAGKLVAVTGSGGFIETPSSYVLSLDVGDKAATEIGREVVLAIAETAK
jgi:NAD(P)-dependent dehydrogenase (short-subunit alcohol dehydrogenase family)